MPQHGPTRDVRWLRFELPVTLASTAEARRRVHQFDAIVDGLRQDLELLLTEAVSNVARHSGLGESDSMRVQVAAAPGYAWVEVFDPGNPLPELQLPIEGPQEPGGDGLGLLLIDRVATRWGTVPGSGATVWFELEERNGQAIAGSRT
jgi:hypothetical protein